MYYPDQRAISPLTAIRREVMLPDEAAGVVRANEGQRVDIRDVVVNGVITNGYVIIEAAQELGLKNPDELVELMHVKLRDVVQEEQVLAGKNPRRGKRVLAPIRGIVAQIRDGRIILQKPPELIDMEAGVRGRITQIYDGRGVVVESVGARVQGTWGNGRNTIATMQLGPEGELTMAGANTLEMRYSGTVVLSRQPLQKTSLRAAQEQNLAGVIAPSMDASLREMALGMKAAILLTEGFGKMRMSAATFSLLSDFDGKQVTVDADTPGRWMVRSPEVVINVPAGDRRPSRPNAMLSIRTGMTVRLMREPYAGATGKVIDLPKSPILLDNGLRAVCAQVELVAGEKLFVPLANVEVLSR